MWYLLIYFSIHVIPQHQLSLLRYIFVTGFLNVKDMNYFGNHATLHGLIDILEDLYTNGITICCMGTIKKIDFHIGQVLGDNLGLNEKENARTVM